MQRHSGNLIKTLALTKNIDLIVIHPHHKKLFASFPDVTEMSVKGIDFSKNYLIECYKYSKRVYKIINQYPNHIIYSQGLAVWYKAKEIKQKLIINPHGLEPYQAYTVKDKLIALPFILIFNHLFRTADKVISLGGKLTEILHNTVKDKSKVAVIPNAVFLPIETNNFQQKKNTILNCLFIARFASNKGINILMKALKELNDEGYKEKIFFNLGGKGPLFEYYKKNYNFSNVNYLGFVSDEELSRQYNTNDLFVFPTLFEGMPTVVLEAMSRKMPIIVSDVGATAELVDETNGCLIEKGNVKTLKKAIKNFYNLSFEERKRLGVNSYSKVASNFTWERVAQMHIDLFNSLRFNS